MKEAVRPDMHLDLRDTGSLAAPGAGGGGAPSQRGEFTL